MKSHTGGTLSLQNQIATIHVRCCQSDQGISLGTLPRVLVGAGKVATIGLAWTKIPDSYKESRCSIPWCSYKKVGHEAPFLPVLAMVRALRNPSSQRPVKDRLCKQALEKIAIWSAGLFLFCTICILIYNLLNFFTWPFETLYRVSSCWKLWLHLTLKKNFGWTLSRCFTFLLPHASAQSSATFHVVCA